VTPPIPNSLFNLEKFFSKAIPENSRRLAWNGISFCVPQNWEIASYANLSKGITRVVAENEYTMRLETEWVYSNMKIDLEKIMKSYQEASKALTLHADSQHALNDLPEHWNATHFVFKETSTENGQELKVFSHELVTIFYTCPHKSLFCYFILHFLPENPENPIQTTQELVHSFENHAPQNETPWQLFDAQFKMPKSFKLTKTVFDIGSKLMAYEWDMRRFYIWHFSCADMFLKEDLTPEKWVLGLLKAFRTVRGIKYYSKSAGEITWKRKWLHPVGHFDEIIRACFQYKIGFHLDKEKNQLVVWLYHYRNKRDLDFLFKND
jgi:hypothetical protein